MRKIRVKSITLTILTESPIALSNDQGTGGNFTPIKKYFYKDGMHAMTSVSTITYELRKKLFKDYGWKLNDIIIKKSNSKIKDTEISLEEADVFGFLIPDTQASKTSPLRIIPFVSINAYRNDTQLITNRGTFDQSLGRKYFDETGNILTTDKIPKTQALANEEVMGDYYSYTVTFELDRIGKTEIDSSGNYLLPESQKFMEREKRKKVVLDLLDAISEMTREIKHQTIHLKPIAVYGGIFQKVIPYFWNDMKFENGKLNVEVFNGTLSDYALFEEGEIIAAIDEERIKGEITGKLEAIKGKRPVTEIKKICKLIDENKLTIGEDNLWYLEV